MHEVGGFISGYSGYGDLLQGSWVEKERIGMGVVYFLLPDGGVVSAGDLCNFETFDSGNRDVA